jgi:hypothetical protein
MGDSGGSLGFGSNGVWFTIAIVVLVVVRFLARELRVRKVPLSRFFLVPIVVCLLSLWLIFIAFETAPSLLLELTIGIIAAIAVGSGVGLAIDRYTTLSLSDDRKVAFIRGSWATVGIWVAALLLRQFGHFVAEHVADTHNFGMTMVLNATLLVLVAAAIVVLRLRLFARAKSLSAAQRTAAPA